MCKYSHSGGPIQMDIKTMMKEISSLKKLITKFSGHVKDIQNRPVNEKK